MWEVLLGFWGGVAVLSTAIGVLGFFFTWDKIVAWWRGTGPKVKLSRLTEHEKNLLRFAPVDREVARLIDDGLVFVVPEKGASHFVGSGVATFDEMERDGLFERQGGRWYLTELGKELKRKLQQQEGITSGGS